MMKLNKLLLVLMLTFISATAIGCGGNSEATKAPSGEDSAAADYESEKIILPEERPALTGQVKDITGNEVTVYKVQFAQTGGTQPEEGKKPAGRETPPNDQGTGPGNRAGFKITGETETFLIPVGTPIVTMQRGTKEITRIGLSEIKKDQILRVWKKDDTVYFVQVMGGNRPGTENPEGTNGPRPGDMPGFGGMGGGRQP